MRRAPHYRTLVLTVLLSILISSSCTPQQITAWFAARGRTVDPAVAQALSTYARQSPEQKVRAAAAEFGVDGNLMVSIARCESGLRPDARNSSSGALGLFQHLPRYWPARAAGLGYSPGSWSDPRANARVSARMIRDGGTAPWNASRHCWG